MLLSNTTTPFMQPLRQEGLQRKDIILNTNIIIAVGLTQFKNYTNES